MKTRWISEEEDNEDTRRLMNVPLPAECIVVEERPECALSEGPRNNKAFWTMN